MRSNPRIAVILLLLLALGACEGADEVAPGELRSMVLQPSDLGAGFLQFDFGRQDFLDYHKGPRRDPERFGRQDGWKARYRKEDSKATTGPLVVESRVDLFGDDEGAARDIEAYKAEFDTASGDSPAHLVSVPSIGDTVFAMTVTHGRGKRTVRYFQIAWREGNVTAFVDVSGFDDGLSLADALRLARRQQRRILAATSG